MKRWYFIRWIRVNIRKHPIISLSALVAFLIGLYFFLKQFSWGDEVINVLSAILSTEVVILRLKDQGKELLEIIIWLVITDAVNITIDLIVVSKLLKWKFFISLMKIITNWWRRLVSEIKKLIQERRKSVNNIKPLKRLNNRFNGTKHNSSKVGSLIVNFIKKFIQRVKTANIKFNLFKKINNQLKRIRNNPSKVGILAVYFISILPRFPPVPGVPGGVAIAVFVIKYNNYGYKGWIALGCGIITKHTIWIGSIYGLSSFF